MADDNTPVLTSIRASNYVLLAEMGLYELRIKKIHLHIVDRLKVKAAASSLLRVLRDCFHGPICPNPSQY